MLRRGIDRSIVHSLELPYIEKRVEFLEVRSALQPRLLLSRWVSCVDVRRPHPMSQKELVPIESASYLDPATATVNPVEAPGFSIYLFQFFSSFLRY